MFDIKKKSGHKSSESRDVFRELRCMKTMRISDIKCMKYSYVLELVY